MTDINLKTLTPDTSLPTTGFLFGADSQASTNPSVYSTQTVATTLLGSTSLTGDTLTADAPVLNLAQTWNNGAVTFTGIKYNATSTASASGSLLMDLQVGASSKFNVDKTGNINTGGTFITSASQAWVSSANSANARLNSSGLKLAANTLFGWTDTTNESNASLDLILRRKGAANLQFGAADAASPVAQTLSVQSIVGGVSTDASAAAYPFTINGAQGTGTGAGGSIVFKVAPAAGSSSNAQNALATALTIASDKTATFAGGTVFQGLYNQIGTGALGSIINFGTGGVELMCSANDTLRLRNLAETLSAYLAVDANNIFAIRNTTNAQTLNIYNTYTSSTSFERYSIDWITTANLAIVGPNKGSGGGTQRVQRLSYLEDGGAGSTVPLLGSTCPAASGTVKSWIKIITSDGTTAYIPCWA